MVYFLYGIFITISNSGNRSDSIDTSTDLEQTGNLDTYVDEFLKLSANISRVIWPEPNRVVTFLTVLDLTFNDSLS